MDMQTSKDILEAGTGFMAGLAETVKKFERKGYTENLIGKYDHLECQSGTVKIFPKDFVVDELVRFENTSDPDDQSALYAISIPEKNLKGLFVESFGKGQEELSRSMVERLKQHPH